MSRIFEALQRAELERKSAEEAEEAQDTGAAVAPADAEAPKVIENIVTRCETTPQQWAPSMPSLPTLEDRGECVEQFRSIRSHIYALRFQAPLKTILVSSGMPSEGKTFVASNLAMSLARNNDRRVLLIDGDLRRPTIHKLLGAPQSPGLVDFLAGNAALNTIIQTERRSDGDPSHVSKAMSNIAFIPAGECGENTLELVGNHRIEELIEFVSSHFDWIVIDSPPVLAVTDAVDLARAADAVVLVAREGKTPFDVAKRAQAAFSNSRILGFVLNASKDAPHGGYYYDYYSGQNTGSKTKGREGKRR